MAEKLVFGEVSSGAADDLRQATNMARRMVTEWGMSELIGPMSLSDNGPVFLGDYTNTQEYSAETSKLIDEEVRRILLDMEARCANLLEEKRSALDFIARQLLERETVSGDEILRLISKADEPPVVQPVTARSYPAPGHRD
jgi:cell division protease FtsH